MRKHQRTLALFVLSCIMLLLVACRGGEEVAEGKDSEAASQQVLNVMQQQDIATMDSTQATDNVSFTAMGQVFEGLYRLGKNDVPILGMAKRKPAITETENGGAIYTFSIREDAKWSDGTPVTAKDFLFAWRKALAPETLSQYAKIFGSSGAHIKNADAILTKDDPLYGNVAALGVKALDAKTLQIEVEQQTSYFSSLLAFQPFLPQPREFAEKQGDDYAIEVANMLYNGPFVMSEWKHGIGWQFKKNPTYWDADTVTLEEVNVKIVPNKSTAVHLYKTGEMDMTGLSADFVEPFAKSGELVQYGTPSVSFWRLNQNVKALQNKYIRKALYTAFDRTALVDVILNNGSIEATYFVPQNFVKGPNGDDFRAYHPKYFANEGEEEAKQYWQKGLEELGIDTLELEFLTTDRELSGSIATYAKEQLESKLEGLTLLINKQPWNSYLEKQQHIDYDIAAGSGWGPDYADPMSFLEIFTTKSGNNRMGYSNPKYDEWIEKAKVETAAWKRWQMLQEAERILMEEDVAIIPTFQLGRSILQKPYVKNYYRHGIGPSASLKWVEIAVE